MTADPVATPASILVVEDEQDLLELLRHALERENHRVTTAAAGEQAMRSVQRQPPDLILLDLMLPGMDGLEVCRALKADERTAAIPLIMLSAKGEEPDIVLGLELGADDYLPKPFSPRVLLARITAVLRRRRKEGPGGESDRLIEVGQVIIDHDRHEVRAAGRRVSLTATEFKTLALLAGRPGRVFTRQQIIDSIHEGMAAVTDRSVDVQMVALRKKLGEAGNAIQTVRGVGYRLRD